MSFLFLKLNFTDLETFPSWSLRVKISRRFRSTSGLEPQSTLSLSSR